MIRFLIDSSALWRVLREPSIRSAWTEVISAHAVGACAPQRMEFRRSARTADELDDMSEMFEALYPDVAVDKSLWRWIDPAQRRLARNGAHKALSAVDLMICGIAAHHGLTVLHDDHDFATAARHLSDVTERSVRNTPPDSPIKGATEH